MDSQPKVFILAGGLGTRLRSVVSDLPKPMAPIAGRPFLEYQLRLLAGQGFRRFGLLVGYRAEAIQNHFGSGRDLGIEITYSVETEPLGTGGALRQALGDLRTPEDLLVLNGDSLLTTNYRDFVARAKQPITLALHESDDLSRYGAVEVGGDGRITKFREKSEAKGRGWINAGVYFLGREAFAHFPGAQKFSLETELFQEGNAPLFGVPCTGNFIDIGVPESFAEAQRLLPRWVEETTPL